MRDGGCVLEARGLTKRYGRHPAVSELDLALGPGEVVGLLGPNGAGKTTLLRVLIGALRATAGTVSVLGLDPWRQAAALHARVGYLPGDLRLPPDLTGEQLLRLIARLRGLEPAAHASLAERVHAPLDAPLRALSKGNRQKVGLIQAFLGAPEVLLLDEPTSGLDPMAQEVVDQLVLEAAARGALVVLSSHVLSEVERVADRVAMLRAGRLVAVDRLDDLRAGAPHRVSVRTTRAWTPPAGVQDVQVKGDLLTCTAPARALDDLVKALGDSTVLDLVVEPADLESLFLSYYEGARGEA